MRLRNLWYKSAVIYELDIRAFYDSDGNGWGDFQGAIQRLDYLSALGVTCLWLKPFMESPQRDGGYDITDHYAVDPRLGSMGDFVEFLHEASSRGIAVMADLVVNHTSIDHPWFQESASSPDSPMAGYYIWRDEPPPRDEWPESVLFESEDDGPWTLHEPSGRYYLHRFYRHEPDLDNANPEVREEVLKMIGFYVTTGIAGFRIDAAPYLAKKAAAAPEYEDAHDYLRALRDFLVGRRPDSVFMAEADVPVERLGEYFGNGDEMNLMLNFLLSEHLFLALAEGDATELYELLGTLPLPPPSGQYANFLRNHDELDLEMLTEDEQELVFETFAPDESMRIFGRGIRRRVAPMLDGDQRRIRLLHSLLFAMPGTPIIYYGDEIGMGEDLSLDDRDPVRTPMQWTPEANGGFSRAPREDLVLPPVESGPFRFEKVNVADQRGDPDSLLNWMRRLVAIRKEARPVGQGDWRPLNVNDPAVLALEYHLDGEVTLVLHNLSDRAVEIGCKPERELAFLHEGFANRHYGHPDLDSGVIGLDAFGYRWLRGSAVGGPSSR